MREKHLHTFLVSLLGAIFAAVPTFASAQNNAATIALTTEKKFGEELAFWVKPIAENSTVKVDWGDGKLKSYTINPNAYAHERKIAGAVKGEKITIHAQLSELECASAGLTGFAATAQEALTLLDLHENSLTSDGLVLMGLESVAFFNLNENKLTRLDLRPLKKLTFFSAAKNKSLGGLLFPEGATLLSSISLADCDVSKFDPKPLPVLAVLDLSNNALMELELGNNFPELKDLNVEGNHIKELDLSGVVKLEKLSVAANQLSRIDVSLQKELLSLFASKNKIDALGLANNTKLTNLDCSENQLQHLNVETLPNLTSLNCSKNKIASLEFSKNMFLKALRCAENLIPVLNLSANNRLSHIDCRRNKRMTACSVNFMFATMWPCSGKAWNANLLLEGCNAEGSNAETVTSADYNWKVDISFDKDKLAQCDSLNFATKSDEQAGKIVFLQYDPVKNEYRPLAQKAFSGAPILVKALPVAGKHFMGIKVNGKKEPSNPFIISENVTVEALWQNETTIMLGCAVGQKLSFALTALNDGSITVDWGDGVPVEYKVKSGESKRLNNAAQGSKIIINGSFTTADFSSYPEMNTWDNALTSFTSSGQRELAELSLYHNPIKTLDLSSCPKLKVLDCAYTKLSKLNLSKNLFLEKLKCHGNALSELDLSKNSKLLSLECHNNALTSLELKANALLEKLDAQNNMLTEIDLTTLQGLKTLRLANNKLQALNVKGIFGIRTLTLSNNQLSALDLATLEDLRVLYVDGNSLKRLNLGKSQALAYVNIANNGLDACALNDFFYTLPEYPKQIDVTLTDNCALRVSSESTENSNDAAKAESTLATVKGWKINEQGDGAGCPTSYITILPPENGTLEIEDGAGKAILSGRTVKKETLLTLKAKPARGYKIDHVKANGKRVEGEKLSLKEATWLQALFILDTSIDKITGKRDFELSGRILTILTPASETTLYNANGEVVLLIADSEAHSLEEFPSGSYILRIESDEAAVLYKLILQ